MLFAEANNSTMILFGVEPESALPALLFLWRYSEFSTDSLCTECLKNHVLKCCCSEFVYEMRISYVNL